MRRILFIVVDYNNHAFTIALANSLAAQMALNQNFTVNLLVVNNSDNTRASVGLEQGLAGFDWARIVCPEANLGYFGGLNFGLEQSGSEADYVVIGNNDLLFGPEFCQLLAMRRYPKNTLVVAPAVVTPDGRHQNPHVLRRSSWIRKLKFDIYFSNYFVASIISFLAQLTKRGRTPTSQTIEVQIEQQIEMGVGACYVLLPEFFLHYQTLFFPGFLYGEEACLAWQVRQAGGTTLFDPSLKVVHTESASCSLLPRQRVYSLGRASYWRYREFL